MSVEVTQDVAVVDPEACNVVELRTYAKRFFGERSALRNLLHEGLALIESGNPESWRIWRREVEVALGLAKVVEPTPAPESQPVPVEESPSLDAAGL